MVKLSTFKISVESCSTFFTKIMFSMKNGIVPLVGYITRNFFSTVRTLNQNTHSQNKLRAFHLKD